MITSTFIEKTICSRVYQKHCSGNVIGLPACNEIILSELTQADLDKFNKNGSLVYDIAIRFETDYGLLYVEAIDNNLIKIRCMGCDYWIRGNDV